MNIDMLKQISLFAGLPDDKLRWLMASAETVTLQRGEVLMAEGSPPDAFYVVLDGSVEILKRSGGQEIVITVRGAGEMMGEMSLIENAPRGATVRSVRNSTFLKISRELFEDLLCGNVGTALSILRTVMQRLRTTEAMVGQNDRLVSLGTLAAGLAHELNNPAAAARRSAGQLQATITQWLEARTTLDALHLDPMLNEEVVCRLRDDLARRAQHDLEPDPLAQSDREYALELWLTARGLDDAYEHAASLVAFGWDVPQLEQWTAQFAPAQVPVIVRWLAIGYSVHGLLYEVNNSAERISEIVKAVKDYSYLDQAPLKEIDVHDGLESTLTMLKHKLKQGVRVVREYDAALPHIEAYASELNQVWTNLIDNAIDATQSKGELRLKTSDGGDNVIVEIADNGPGIAADVLPRIFQPFYTTKGPGVGTGLGLHVSFNIIQKHHGHIDVQSKPGETRFIISLPKRIRDAA